jgi:phosphate transport system substrate-binding protein
MKRTILLLSGLAFVWSSFTIKPGAPKPDDLQGTISISGAFALYPMAVKWGEEFKKLHPNVKFDISAGGAGKGISDALGGMVDLGAVSRDIYSEETKKGAFPVAVTKDAVIPTVNAANPNIKEILTKGIKKDAFANIYATGLYKNWKQAGFSVSAPIHAYTRSDAAGAAETVYDGKTKKQIPGIAVVPIDINNNGKVDAEENFYGTLDELIKAVAAGKYPSPPARDLYFVSKGKPQKKIVVEFLKWVLADGQKYVTESGYIVLPKEKIEAELKKVSG